MKMKNAVRAFLKEEDGVTMIEYALIAALISVASMAAMKALSLNITGLFNSIGAAVNPATT
jgi:pilus assembly protein Flp/PilA